MNYRFALAFAAALGVPLMGGVTSAQTPPAKISVTDEAQLPRFSYPMTMAPSVLVLADDATFAAFANQVGADVDKTLATYDIGDLASKRDLLQAKLSLQLLSHDDDGARATIAAIRATQSKADRS